MPSPYIVYYTLTSSILWLNSTRSLTCTPYNIFTFLLLATLRTIHFWRLPPTYMVSSKKVVPYLTVLSQADRHTCIGGHSLGTLISALELGSHYWNLCSMHPSFSLYSPIPWTLNEGDIGIELIDLTISTSPNYYWTWCICSNSNL